MHRPSRPHSLPEGIRCARRVGSRLPAPPAKRPGRWCESLRETTSLDPRRRTVAPVQAPKRVAKSTVRRPLHRRRAHAGVATFASTSAPRPSLRSDSTGPDVVTEVTAQPSLSTLSVGYTNVVDGCPSTAPACQQQRNGNHFRSAAWNARLYGSRWGFAATLPSQVDSRRPCQTGDPSTLGTQSMPLSISHHNTVRFGR